MDGFSILHTAEWQPQDVTALPEYAAGNALGWLHRGNKQAATNHLLSGRLYLSKNGWLFLSVPNALVRGVYDALTAPGAELPTSGVWNIEGDKADLLNAHISVMTADEVNKIGPDKINERGHMFGYSLGALKEIDQPDNHLSRVWAIQVSSPSLSALRKSYGLSALPNGDHAFHITVAVRRKNVLKDNDVSRFDVAPSRGELKVAAVYNFEGDVQGVSLRKTLHKILEESNRPGLMYNDARTGEARAVLPGTKNQQKVVLDLLRQRLSDRAQENALLTGRPGEAKQKKPLQEGVDYKILPVPAARARMNNVTMTPADIQNFIQTQGFNRLAAEKPEYQKQWLGERYRLRPDASGNLAGAVPTLAKKQLFHGEPVYAYQTVPGWNDEKASSAAENKHSNTLSRAGKKDLLPGGKADNIPEREFSTKALAEGQKDEREHTSNDQVAKEIAKDHLLKDPQHYKKETLMEKVTAPQMPAIVRLVTKQAESVYLNQAMDTLNMRRPIQYDHTKPVFENIQNQMQEMKRRGDFIMQSRRNHEMYMSALSPQYRYQRMMQAFHNKLPQANPLDTMIENYGDSALNQMGGLYGQRSR